MGTGYDFAFSTLDDNLVKSVMSEAWSGKNYSSRIWGNTDILAETVSEIVGGALLSGQSYAKTSRQLRERFNVAKYYADRLVRTECNYFHNQADAMAYEEMDVDKYVFVAVLDTRTSTICQNLDNEVIDLKDKQVGVNYPPMHPNCRSTTRAYMGEEIEKTLQRRARNPVTGENEVIGNISYKEWAEKHGLLTNKGKSNIINEKSKGDITNITNKAISRVPKIKINGYTDEQNAFIQEQHKELLRYAKDNNNSNEVAFIFRKGLTDKNIVKGTDKKIDITEAIRGKGSGLHIMHNHPRNGSISYDDVLELFACDEISTMSIIKNNGSVEVANKLPNFNKKKAVAIITRAKNKYVTTNSDTEYELAVKKALNKLQKEEFLQWIT
jgi:SPP1 gp7 family putative phage head morphogenesis protein